MKIFLTILLGLSSLSLYGASDKNVPEFFQRTRTTIKDPFEMRDPFKKRAQKLKSSSTKGFTQNRTTFSNLPTLEGVPLDRIRIVGVILGDDRRAIAKMMNEGEASSAPMVSGEDTFVVKEGMTLGINKAEVKAILPGGIVLVEKIRNVYDQDEYIETIIPVTVE